MRLELSKFGILLISRPSGREAYLAAKAYSFPGKMEKIEIDFSGVKVLTPSWISEFISLFKKDYPKVKITFIETNNPTVSSSLEML